MSAPPRPERGLRRDIQGLRAVAVLLVVADHVFRVPGGGFIGVDVFFVISGFLITGILLRDQRKTGRFSFDAFYRKRIRRILPAAMVTLAVTIVAARLVFNAGRAQAVFWDGVWAALFAANWRFAQTETDYFASAAPPSPLQHFWSLSVEEQFYFVWPVVLLLCALAARRAGRWDDAARARSTRLAVGAIVTISALSLAWAFFETATAPQIAYFSTFSRAWELGVGALLAILAPRVTGMPAALRAVIAWIGLAGIAAAVVLITPQSAFPAPWAVLPVVSTALVILAGSGGTPPLSWPLTNRVSVYVGDISYSLYLWHFPAIIVGGPLLAIVFGEASVLVTVAILLLSFALAMLSYHFVEQPIRRSSWLLPGRARRGARWAPRHLIVGGAAAATTVLVALALVVAPGPSSTSAATSAVSGPRLAPLDDAAGSAASAPAQAALSEKITAALAATEWPTDLQPGLERLDDEVLPGETGRCGGPSLPADPAVCTFGDPEAPHKAVLVGDSIAQMYVPALAEIFGTGDWQLRITSMYSCPFVDVPIGQSQPAVDLCSQRKETAIGIIEESQPDVVIVANTYLRFVNFATGAQATPSEWDAGFRALMARVAPHAGAMVALPPPIPDRDIVECFTPLSSPADCVSSMSATDWAAMASMQRAAMDELEATFVDNRAWFCDEAGRCPAFVDSVIVKKDQAHITADYARFIIPVVDEVMRAAGVFGEPGAVDDAPDGGGEPVTDGET